MEELNIPAAFCPDCNEIVPVHIEEVELDDDDVPVLIRGMTVKAVFCVACTKFLNSGEEELKIEFYSIEDLEDLGWKAVPVEEEA